VESMTNLKSAKPSTKKSAEWLTALNSAVETVGQFERSESELQ
jgi:hypothetical protein